MKINYTLTLLFLGFTLIFSSCKKDEAVTPAVSKTDLISRKWGTTEVYVDGDGKKVVIFGAARPADLSLTTTTSVNDYFLFSKDGKLDVYSDDKKKTVSGTWKFVNSEAQVQLIYGTTNQILSIDNLTDKTSELSRTVSLANATTATEDEKNIILIGAFAGVVTNTTTKVKFGLKLIAK